MAVCWKKSRETSRFSGKLLWRILRFSEHRYSTAVTSASLVTERKIVLRLSRRPFEDESKKEGPNAMAKVAKEPRESQGNRVFWQFGITGSSRGSHERVPRRMKHVDSGKDTTTHERDRQECRNSKLGDSARSLHPSFAHSFHHFSSLYIVHSYTIFFSSTFKSVHPAFICSFSCLPFRSCYCASKRCFYQLTHVTRTRLVVEKNQRDEE